MARGPRSHTRSTWPMGWRAFDAESAAYRRLRPGGLGKRYLELISPHDHVGGELPDSLGEDGAILLSPGGAIYLIRTLPDEKLW